MKELIISSGGNTIKSFSAKAAEVHGSKAHTVAEKDLIALPSEAKVGKKKKKVAAKKSGKRSASAARENVGIQSPLLPQAVALGKSAHEDWDGIVTPMVG